MKRKIYNIKIIYLKLFGEEENKLKKTSSPLFLDFWVQ